MNPICPVLGVQFLTHYPDFGQNKSKNFFLERPPPPPYYQSFLRSYTDFTMSVKSVKWIQFVLGAIHKRRWQLGGGNGSKIGQKCRRIVLKNCRHGGRGEGRGCQKFGDIADVVYGWSPVCFCEQAPKSSLRVNWPIWRDIYLFAIYSNLFQKALRYTPKYIVKHA